MCLVGTSWEVWRVLTASQNLNVLKPGSLLWRVTRLRTQRRPIASAKFTPHLQNLRVLMSYHWSLIALWQLSPVALLHPIHTPLTPMILLHHYCPIKSPLLLISLFRIRSLFLLTLPGLTALILRIPLRHQSYLTKLLHRLIKESRDTSYSHTQEAIPLLQPIAVWNVGNIFSWFPDLPISKGIHATEKHTWVC